MKLPVFLWEDGLVTDAQVRRLREKRMAGKTLTAAAAGMSARTARRWQAGTLPSAAKALRRKHRVAREAAAARLAASMRPQHITAENHYFEHIRISKHRRFNEAAAYHCGKRGIWWDLVGTGGIASMRPQHITAENRARAPARRRRACRFNEAAAYHCGKRDAGVRRRREGRSLQ